APRTPLQRRSVAPRFAARSAPLAHSLSSVRSALSDIGSRSAALSSVDRPERAVQPRARELPFVLDGRGREVERGGGLFDAEPGEVPQRDDLRLARVGLLEPGERLVDGYEIGQRGIGAHDAAIEIDAVLVAAVLDALVVARALDEDAPHGERRGGEEMPAAVPPAILIARHAQVRLVHERGRLQRLVRL